MLYLEHLRHFGNSRKKYAETAPKTIVDAERHRRTPRLSAISGWVLGVRFAGLLAVVDSMRDAGWNWPCWALCCIRESINGKFLAVGFESQSGICSNLVCDIHIWLLMLWRGHGSFFLLCMFSACLLHSFAGLLALSHNSSSLVLLGICRELTTRMFGCLCMPTQAS